MPAAKPAAAKAASAPKMPKLPKSLGACVDLYKEWSAKRLGEKKHLEAYELIEKSIKEHIIDNVPKGDAGAVGTNYKAIVFTAETFQVEDWESFYKWIKANDAFDVLNRAVNQAAIEDRTNALNAKLDEANMKAVGKGQKPAPRKMLPGLKTFSVVKLSVTKK